MRIKQWLWIVLLVWPLTLMGKSEPPEVTVDGLHRVASENVDLLYALPGTDLSTYDRVFLLAPEVRFVKNYKQKANQMYKFRITDDDMQRIREDLAQLFAEVFFDELQSRGGYQLVTSLGEGVLIVRPAIIDLDVLAPDAMDRPNSRSALPSAGRMTLYLELADGVSNTVLAKALDYQYDRTRVQPYKNSERNEQAARQIIGHWAELLRQALDEAHSKASASESG
jgi:hypothetical protein